MPALDLRGGWLPGLVSTLVEVNDHTVAPGDQMARNAPT
jgi:hypothetical protein